MPWAAVVPWPDVRARAVWLTGWTDAEICRLPQGRFLAYVDAIERARERDRLTLASYIGMAVGGADQRVWDQLWEATLTPAELEAHYEQGWQTLVEIDARRRHRR